MFSIENLLSNKYSSKSSQNAVGKNRHQLDSIISATTPITSRKISHSNSINGPRRSSGGTIEMNSFAGKRDTLYLELSTAAAAAITDDFSRPPSGVGRDDEERKATVDTPRARETPHSKMLMTTARDGGEGEESQSVADLRLGSKVTAAVVMDGDGGGGEKTIEGTWSSGRKLKRRRSSDVGREGESESDSSSEKGNSYDIILYYQAASL